MFAALLCASSSRISTHAPAGGATALSDLVDAVREISTHAPAGGATCSATVAVAIVLPFLLTPLREGRLKSNYMASAAWLFLLTPLREGRLARSGLLVATCQISTHAPAGGATRLFALDDQRRIHISTHAPAGGATDAGRHRHQDERISTHAPAGGATLSCVRSTPSRKFLLTPLREGRPAEIFHYQRR